MPNVTKQDFNKVVLTNAEYQAALANLKPNAAQFYLARPVQGPMQGQRPTPPDDVSQQIEFRYMPTKVDVDAVLRGLIPNLPALEADKPAPYQVQINVVQGTMTGIAVTWLS